MEDITGMKIAVLATHMVEESELVEPRKALDDAGADTDLISIDPGEIISANHFDKSRSYPVDATFKDVEPEGYDGVLLPGGALNADFLRIEKLAQEFVQLIDGANKPIAVICHGPWLLVSAKLVPGRELTSFHTIADDIKNAGGIWVDEPVVTDQNWVSSRRPDDLPFFNREMLRLFTSCYQPHALNA